MRHGVPWNTESPSASPCFAATESFFGTGSEAHETSDPNEPNRPFDASEPSWPRGGAWPESQLRRGSLRRRFRFERRGASDHRAPWNHSADKPARAGDTPDQGIDAPQRCPRRFPVGSRGRTAGFPARAATASREGAEFRGIARERLPGSHHAAMDSAGEPGTCSCASKMVRWCSGPKRRRGSWKRSFAACSTPFIQERCSSIPPVPSAFRTRDSRSCLD